MLMDLSKERLNSLVHNFELINIHGRTAQVKHHSEYRCLYITRKSLLVMNKEKESETSTDNMWRDLKYALHKSSIIRIF